MPPPNPKFYSKGTFIVMGCLIFFQLGVEFYLFSTSKNHASISLTRVMANGLRMKMFDPLGQYLTNSYLLFLQEAYVCLPNRWPSFFLP